MPLDTKISFARTNLLAVEGAELVMVLAGAGSVVSPNDGLKAQSRQLLCLLKNKTANIQGKKR
jgi:hypothetical protein